jgi:hypothetical protein
MRDKEVMEANLDHWPLPDAYLVELGRIAAAWSVLEAQLDLYLGKLAGFDNLNDFRPFVLIRHSAFPQKLDMLAALCDQLQQKFPQLKRFEDVVSKLKAAQKSRNQFLHNGLTVDDATGAVHMAVGSARGKIKAAVKSVRLADMRRVAMEIHLAMLALHLLVTKKEYRPVWEKRGA